MEEALPLVFIFLIAAAVFSYTSKNIWYIIIAAAGSAAILGIKWIVSRERY